MRIRISMITLLLIILVGGQQLGSQTNANPGGFDLVDGKGNIRKPHDYRDHYPDAWNIRSTRSNGGRSDAQYVCFAWDCGVLPQDGKVRGWNRTCKRGLRDRACSNDDRRRALGLGNESLVRDDQG